MNEDMTDEAMEEAIDIADLRVVEALLFTNSQPLSLGEINAFLPHQNPKSIEILLEALQQDYYGRGIQLKKIGTAYAFRTAEDLSAYLTLEREERKTVPRAASETLAVIAYHQPVTRAEIEDIRGVSLSRGTLDLLLEAGWIRPSGRRQTPGKPMNWVTTQRFLDQFGLGDLQDLPGISELKAAGLLGQNRIHTIAMRQTENLDENLDEIEDDDDGLYET